MNTTDTAAFAAHDEGQSFVFDYPEQFITLLDYSAHRGQQVTIVRPLSENENTSEEPMYLVRASDGWEGHAFDSELAQAVPEHTLSACLESSTK